MAAKDAPCSYCGTAYSLRRLRCPKCHLDREDRPATVTSMDRLAGLVLLSLGVVTAFAISWFVYKSRFARHAIFLLIPLWLLLHGALLLMGIHLRDFYAWWNRLAQPVRILVHLLGFVAFMALVWFLAGTRR